MNNFFGVTTQVRSANPCGGKGHDPVMMVAGAYRGTANPGRATNNMKSNPKGAKRHDARRCLSAPIHASYLGDFL